MAGLPDCCPRAGAPTSIATSRTRATTSSRATTACSNGPASRGPQPELARWLLARSSGALGHDFGLRQRPRGHRCSGTRAGPRTRPTSCPPAATSRTAGSTCYRLRLAGRRPRGELPAHARGRALRRRARAGGRRPVHLARAGPRLRAGQRRRRRGQADPGPQPAHGRRARPAQCGREHRHGRRAQRLDPVALPGRLQRGHGRGLHDALALQRPGRALGGLGLVLGLRRRQSHAARDAQRCCSFPASAAAGELPEVFLRDDLIKADARQPRLALAPALRRGSGAERDRRRRVAPHRRERPAADVPARPAAGGPGHQRRALRQRQHGAQHAGLLGEPDDGSLPLPVATHAGAGGGRAAGEQHRALR